MVFVVLGVYVVPLKYSHMGEAFLVCKITVNAALGRILICITNAFFWLLSCTNIDQTFMQVAPVIIAWERLKGNLRLVYQNALNKPEETQDTVCK